MNDHQTWSMKLWYKYWILTFLNTVKQSKLLVKKILMGGILPNLTEIRKNQRENILTMFDSQTWSRKGMLTMYDHENGQIRLSLFL